MQLNDIDNLFKKGMEESEFRHESHLLEAKPRVWEAIQRPKSKNRHHWMLITSLAATLSMFAIATFLFLKLDSKQKELEVLRAEVNTKMPSAEGNIETESMPLKPKVEKETGTIAVQIQEGNLKKNIIDTEIKGGRVKDESTPSKPEPIATLETPKLDPIAEMDLLIAPTQEIGLEPIETMLKTKEPAIPTKQKKRLKLRIGNGNPTYYDGQNTLAVNIKL